jgi:hypothetical protein
MHPAYQAMQEISRAQRTIFVCRYLRDRELQREINAALNVAESWNAGNAVLHYGNGGDLPGNRRDKQELTVLCLRVLQASVSFLNTLLIQDVRLAAGVLISWDATPMKFVSEEGRFWLPQQPTRIVHGSVDFQEDGVTFNLADSLREPVSVPGGGVGGSPSLASEPFIHGRLHGGREVSLHNARGLSWPVDGIQETWRADFLFIGGLIKSNRFTHVQVVFDYLMPWAQPAGIAKGMIGGDDMTVDTRRVTVDQAILGDRTKVRLRTGVEGRWDHASVHLDQWTAFEVTSLVRKAKTIRGVLDDWVRPLQDLLVVSLGVPVRIDQLAVRLRGQPERAPLLDVAGQLIQPRPRGSPKAADVDSYASPTLLAYRDLTGPGAAVPFADLIPAWFGLYECRMDVVTDLCGPYYAPFMYSGHRYASIFQSAEALAHGLFGSRQKTRPEHRARVDAVTTALEAAGLDADSLSWASRVLLSRNDKPLRQLVEELIAGAGEIGAQLIRAAPGLAEEAAADRARVSHPGSGGPDVIRRYWLGEALAWLVRAHLLSQLGIPMQDLALRAVRQASFEQVLSGLRIDRQIPAARTPGYHHGNCPVAHRTQAAADRCSNR